MYVIESSTTKDQTFHRVGFYSPSGEFIVDVGFYDRETAREHLNYLNGGAKPQEKPTQHFYKYSCPYCNEGGTFTSHDEPACIEVCEECGQEFVLNCWLVPMTKTNKIETTID